MNVSAFPLGRKLAHWSAALEFRDLPPKVQSEVTRAFLNWFGCVLGGSAEEMPRRVAHLVQCRDGAASLIGQGTRASCAEAAFVNCVASSVLAYDDTHLATVTHPTGPVAAALMAEAEVRPIDGPTFLTALAIGIELQCRLSSLLLLPPAKPNLALYITGVTGPVGAAAALGRVRGYDEDQMLWSLGHAATQAAGFRATHGAMAGLIVPGYAARSGVFAADLAGAGIDCPGDALESERGFVGIFTANANPVSATAGLGTDFEILANAYKPYPAGIVLHAAIDACMVLLPQIASSDQIARIRLTVPPLTQALADRPHPRTPYEAPISLQHWAAHVFARGAAGVEALQQRQLEDPVIAALRSKVEIVTEEGLARDAAKATVALADGRVIDAEIAHASGSIDNPMTDAQLDAKFLEQARIVLDDPQTALTTLRALAGADDVFLALKPWLQV